MARRFMRLRYLMIPFLAFLLASPGTFSNKNLSPRCLAPDSALPGQLLLAERLNQIKAVYIDVTGTLYQNDGPYAHERILNYLLERHPELKAPDEAARKEIKKVLSLIFNKGIWAKKVRLGQISFEEFSEIVNLQLTRLIYIDDKYEAGFKSRLERYEYTNPQSYKNTLQEVGMHNLTLLTEDQIFDFMYGDYPPAPHSVELMQALKEAGIKVYALSNDADGERLTHTLKRDFGEDTFAGFFSSSELGFKKPERQIFEQVQERTGFKPEEVLFVDNKPEFNKGAEALNYLTELVTLEKDDDFRRYSLMNRLLKAAQNKTSSSKHSIDKLFIEDLDVEGKQVLVRVDFNVPIEDGIVTDDTRIIGALPTIEYLLQHNAKIILMSHMGKPKGKVDEALRLRPAAKRLSELLPGTTVVPLSDSTGEAVKGAVAKMKPGEIIILENLRFNPGETANDADFAKELASLADIYVNDAFGTAHRAHASISGIAEHMETRAAGYLVEKEIRFLGNAVEKPERPFVAILGGAKVSDKIKVITNLLDKVDTLVIGGAMAYTFLKAKGVPTGNSLVEEDKLELAQTILAMAELKGVEILLPVDHIVADKFEGATSIRTAQGKIPDGTMGLDIGPQTLMLYVSKIKTAKTVIWNGPMGKFEDEAYSNGTFGVAKAIAESDSISVIGGGDSAKAINDSGYAGKMTHISTGGGASLKFLEGKDLPGIVSLSDKKTGSGGVTVPSNSPTETSI